MFSFLVLAGIVVGALAGAGISLVKVLADPYDQLPAITFWLLGSLAGVKANGRCSNGAGRSPRSCSSYPAALGGSASFSLGDDEGPRPSGVEVSRLRTIVITCRDAGLPASVVAISGVIGWVGLMVPHMARLLVGPALRSAVTRQLSCSAQHSWSASIRWRASAARIEISAWRV